MEIKEKYEVKNKKDVTFIANRDHLGRFIKGHKAIPMRDSQGRFTCKASMVSLEEKVDRILMRHDL